LSFSLYCAHRPPHPPSFPTRRSSDLLDDSLYQSVLRSQLRGRLGSSATSRERPEHLDQQAPEVAAEMRTALAAWNVEDLGVHQVRFPWNRSFEVEIDLH